MTPLYTQHRIENDAQEGCAPVLLAWFDNFVFAENAVVAWAAVLFQPLFRLYTCALI